MCPSLDTNIVSATLEQSVFFFSTKETIFSTRTILLVAREK